MTNLTQYTEFQLIIAYSLVYGLLSVIPIVFMIGIITAIGAYFFPGRTTRSTGPR